MTETWSGFTSVFIKITILSIECCYKSRQFSLQPTVRIIHSSALKRKSWLNKVTILPFLSLLSVLNRGFSSSWFSRHLILYAKSKILALELVDYKWTLAKVKCLFISHVLGARFVKLRDRFPALSVRYLIQVNWCQNLDTSEGRATFPQTLIRHLLVNFHWFSSLFFLIVAVLTGSLSFPLSF